MATNDFLVFGGGAGANVMTQAAWAALAARTAGFSSGVAQSAQLNKAWRQSSIMAAVLAQFVADVTGQNATDDGTTAALLSNLKAAVYSQGIVGSMRNAAMSVTAASSTATFTADEIIVETVLGGVRYCLANFSKTINLGTTGPGGMDTGTVPVSGYVALYAIYNPTTGASALLATNATTAAQPEVYGGANMPAGYTASALVAVWRIASSQFTIGYQQGRRLSFPPIQVLSVSAAQASPTSFSVAGAVPLNARRVKLFLAASSSASNSAQQFQVSGNSASCGVQVLFAVTAAAGAGNACNGEVALITPQTLYYQSSNTAGTPSYTLSIVEMEF